MKKTAPAAVIVAASMWGIDSIVLRPSLYTLPVSLVVLIEAGLATLLLTPFFIRDLKILRKFGVRDWLAFLGMAILGGAIGTMAITKALFYVNYINLSIVVLIQKLQPVFALIAAALILKERPPRIFFLWSAIATTGAYIMTFGMAKPNWDAADMIVQAAVYATLAALSFALSTIFSKMALQNVNFGAVTYLRFVFMVGVMLLTVLGSGTYDMIGQITGQQILILLIIALTTGITASFLWIKKYIRFFSYNL